MTKSPVSELKHAVQSVRNILYQIRLEQLHVPDPQYQVPQDVEPKDRKLDLTQNQMSTLSIYLMQLFNVYRFSTRLFNGSTTIVEVDDNTVILRLKQDSTSKHRKDNNIFIDIQFGKRKYGEPDGLEGSSVAFFILNPGFDNKVEELITKIHRDKKPDIQLSFAECYEGKKFEGGALIIKQGLVLDWLENTNKSDLLDLNRVGGPERDFEAEGDCWITSFSMA